MTNEKQNELTDELSVALSGFFSEHLFCDGNEAPEVLGPALVEALTEVFSDAGVNHGVLVHALGYFAAVSSIWEEGTPPGDEVSGEGVIMAVASEAHSKFLQFSALSFNEELRDALLRGVAVLATVEECKGCPDCEPEDFLPPGNPTIN